MDSSESSRLPPTLPPKGPARLRNDSGSGSGGEAQAPNLQQQQQQQDGIPPPRPQKQLGDAVIPQPSMPTLPHIDVNRTDSPRPRPPSSPLPALPATAFAATLNPPAVSLDDATDGDRPPAREPPRPAKKTREPAKVGTGEASKPEPPRPPKKTGAALVAENEEISARAAVVEAGGASSPIINARAESAPTPGSSEELADEQAIARQKSSYPAHEREDLPQPPQKPSAPVLSPENVSSFQTADEQLAPAATGRTASESDVTSASVSSSAAANPREPLADVIARTRMRIIEVTEQRDFRLAQWQKWSAKKRQKRADILVEIEDCERDLARFSDHLLVLVRGGQEADEIADLIRALETQEGHISDLNQELRIAERRRKMDEKKKDIVRMGKAFKNRASRTLRGSVRLGRPLSEVMSDDSGATDDSGNAYSSALSESNTPTLPRKEGRSLTENSARSLAEGDDSQALDARWRIKFEDLEFGKELAAGNFGLVMRAQYFENDCVIKQLHEQTPEAVQALVREAAQLSRLRTHASICTFYGACLDPRSTCLVFEYISGGSLGSYLLDRRRPLFGRDIVSLAKDLAGGMIVLHDGDVLHLDLSARNLLVMTHEQPLKLRICDFGQSQTVPEGRVSVPARGSSVAFRWLDPLAVKRTAFAKSTDIWAFGVVVVEMLSREIPYPDLATKDVMAYVLGGGRMKRPDLSQGQVGDSVAEMDFMFDLATKCWCDREEDRPTFREIAKAIGGFARTLSFAIPTSASPAQASAPSPGTPDDPFIYAPNLARADEGSGSDSFQEYGTMPDVS